MIKPTDFDRMWIVVPPGLRDLLADGNVLTCSHERVQFALAYVDRERDAQRTQTDLRASDARPAYVLLLTPDQRETIESGGNVEVDVLTSDLTKVGVILLTGEDQNLSPLRTEHGTHLVISTVLANLKAGDFFAVSERNDWREWVVYRALGDAADGTIQAQRTTSSDEPGVTFTGAYQVLFLVTDRAAMLRDLGWQDLQPTAAR